MTQRMLWVRRPSWISIFATLIFKMVSLFSWWQCQLLPWDRQGTPISAKRRGLPSLWLAAASPWALYLSHPVPRFLAGSLGHLVVPGSVPVGCCTIFPYHSCLHCGLSQNSAGSWPVTSCRTLSLRPLCWDNTWPDFWDCLRSIYGYSTGSEGSRPSQWVNS